MKFGPAGNSDYFGKHVSKSSLDAPAYVASLGLDAYEYQCGRGVNIGAERAAELGKRAKENGVQISLHSPYYISLSNPEKTEGNLRYILDSCRTVDLMGGDRVVVHTGSAGKDRAAALKASAESVKTALKALEEAGLAHVRLCLETMGKINQLGTLDEVLQLCAMDERLLPCVDFGHLYARTHGEFDSAEQFELALDKIESMLGRARAEQFHIHFSRIEYSAGGEVRHTVLDDPAFGPHFELLAPILVKRGYRPTLICESAGTQAEDAAKMRAIYLQEKEKNAV